MFRSYYSVFKVRLGDVPQSPVSRNFDFHHMVGQNGLEPSTSRLSVVCSSQLSYWPMWWRLRESNPWPPACKAGALPAELNPHIRFWVTPFQGPQNRTISNQLVSVTCSERLSSFDVTLSPDSLERRWSSRRFSYGYLVTTSPQSPVLPSAASSLRLDYRLRVPPALMVWRAVCTRPGNVFTAACWSAITSNSDFVQASCSLQSELGRCFWVLLHLAVLLLFV